MTNSFGLESLRTVKCSWEKTKPLYKKLHFSSLYKFKNVIHVVHWPTTKRARMEKHAKVENLFYEAINCRLLEHTVVSRRLFAPFGLSFGRRLVPQDPILHEFFNTAWSSTNFFNTARIVRIFLIRQCHLTGANWSLHPD